MAVGAWLWRRQARADGLPGALASGQFVLLAGLLIGAGVGNKLVFFIERPDLWLAFWRDGAPLKMGQSIVGGLLGGLIGIELAKRWTGQRASTGDRMVVPLLVGMAIGRVGCFVAGLHDDTYGLPTTLPWGVDLGDGVARHPSPLYEIVFLACLGVVLKQLAPWVRAEPGLLFKTFLVAYLVWRLVGDVLKPVRVPYPGELSGIQWVCMAALLTYVPLWWRGMKRLRLNQNSVVAPVSQGD